MGVGVGVGVGVAVVVGVGVAVGVGVGVGVGVEVVVEVKSMKVVAGDVIDVDVGSAIVTLSRKGDHLAQVKKDGYGPASLKIDRTWSWWVVGDIVGCLIVFSPLCIMHDIDQGGYYTFDDKIYLTLNRHTISEPPVSK